MLKDFIIRVLIFYILLLIQTSFLVHLSILGQVPNLILIFLFLIFSFEKDSLVLSIAKISSACLLTSFFSNKDWRLLMPIFLFEGILFCEVIKNIKRQNIFIFASLFLFFLFFYEGMLWSFDYFFYGARSFLINKFFLIRALYTLVFSIFGFYLYVWISSLGRSKK